MIHHYVQRGFDWQKIAGADGNEKEFLEASMQLYYEEEAGKLKRLFGKKSK